MAKAKKKNKTAQKNSMVIDFNKIASYEIGAKITIGKLAMWLTWLAGISLGILNYNTNHNKIQDLKSKVRLIESQKAEMKKENDKLTKYIIKKFQSNE